MHSFYNPQLFPQHSSAPLVPQLLSIPPALPTNYSFQAQLLMCQHLIYSQQAEILHQHCWQLLQLLRQLILNSSSFYSYPFYLFVYLNFNNQLLIENQI